MNLSIAKTTAGALLLAMLLPVAGAVEVGVSGECYDGPDDGGEGYLAAGDEGVEHGGVTNLSFVNGVLAFADDQMEGGEEPYCDTDKPGTPDEYVEAHVDADAAYVQACYAGNDAETGVHTEPGECRNRPWSYDRDD